MTKGSCLCGGVTWQTDAPLRPSVACHCTQCRKTSGHYWSATQVPTEALDITADSLTWFRSSATARRGFCSACGASMFWEQDGEGKTSIGSGTIDGPSGITTAKHIYCADKGDYYDLPAGVAQE
ncbi:MAG: GFA family protein [Paracoccaceae bacterium]